MINHQTLIQEGDDAMQPDMWIDELMSPQAKRYWATIHHQSDNGVSESGSGSTAVIASTTDQ
jgi:hypothetical protein